MEILLYIASLQEAVGSGALHFIAALPTNPNSDTTHTHTHIRTRTRSCSQMKTLSISQSAELAAVFVHLDQGGHFFIPVS